MTVAKVVTLRARPNLTAVLDTALSDAHRAAATEPGTAAWEWFPAAESDGRVIVELFADEAAAAEHDASPAVAALRACFVDVLATEPDVRVYIR